MNARFPPIAHALLVAAGLLTACSDERTTLLGPSGVVDSDDSFFIMDATGKRWDVGHGRQYGLEPRLYAGGLGPFRIRPILNPQTVRPGDESYPSGGLFRILGVSLNGSTRAYPLGVMSTHEGVNEVFGDAHVAVAY